MKSPDRVLYTWSTETDLIQTTFLSSTVVANSFLWENLGEGVIVRGLRSMMWNEVQREPPGYALAVLNELGQALWI